MEHVVIGVDPSINSTGICVRELNGTLHKYYIVSSKVTNKSFEWSKTVNWLNIHQYEKRPINNIENYSEKEFVKYENLFALVTAVSYVLDLVQRDYIIDYIVMEGVSYGSVSGAALIDLAFLNAMLRMKFYDYDIKFYIVSPKEVKKQSVGNGNADKDLMVLSWKKLDKKTQDIPTYVKCDDLADAYFMSHYNVKE